VHFLTRSIISSLWCAVAAMAFIDFKIDSVYICLVRQKHCWSYFALALHNWLKWLHEKFSTHDMLSSDSLTRVNHSNQLESRFLVTRIRHESRWERWWLDSSHAFHRMTRLESQSMTRDSSQSYFCKIFEPLMDKRCFRTKKWAFCFGDDQDWRKFSILTV